MQPLNPKAETADVTAEKPDESPIKSTSRRRFLAGVTGAATSAGIFQPVRLLAGSTPGAFKPGDEGPLVIEQLGSFFFGGTTVKGAGTFDPTFENFFSFSNVGDVFWIDQLYVQYLIPTAARSLPIIMVHGAGQTGKTWESTPDARAGYQKIFAKRGFGVYTVDFPTRGKAGFPSFTGAIGDLTGSQVIPDQTVRYGNALAFLLFRLGANPFDYFPNSQFPKAGFNQFCQQIVPFFNDNPDVISSAIAGLFDQIGPGILVTHSQSGQFGWLAAIKSSNVKAVVSYEPGTFYFPSGAVPSPPLLYGGYPPPAVLALPAALADFQKLTRIPIQIVYGDNIPANPVPNYGQDAWRTVTAVASDFVAAINNQGGHASILSLPSIGLFGNTHFAFSDLNNLAVADTMSAFLHLNGLDL